jgi:hypothetical protein
LSFILLVSVICSSGQHSQAGLLLVQFPGLQFTQELTADLLLAPSAPFSHAHEHPKLEEEFGLKPKQQNKKGGQ